MKFEELQAKIAGAKTPQEAAAVIAEYNKTKKDEAAAIQAAIAKENEELSSARLDATTKILERLEKIQSLNPLLESVKSWGFTYKRAGEPDVNGVLRQNNAIALTVPTVKAPRAKGTGTGTKSPARDLNALFEANATQAEREELVQAQATDKSASEKLGRTTNSNAWRVKDKVAKRIGS